MVKMWCINWSQTAQTRAENGPEVVQKPGINYRDNVLEYRNLPFSTCWLNRNKNIIRKKTLNIFFELQPMWDPWKSSLLWWYLFASHLLRHNISSMKLFSVNNCSLQTEIFDLCSLYVKFNKTFIDLKKGYNEMVYKKLTFLFISVSTEKVGR